MISESSNVSEYRYERKMWVTDLTFPEIEALIKHHSSMFSELYNKRWINNIYFDRINFGNYFDNVDGLSNRLKLRIRWYGQLFGKIENPVLELKIKKGLLGRKASLHIPSFELSRYWEVPDLLSGVKMPDEYSLDFSSFKPVLLNRYERKYYQSASGKFRLTLDDHQHFFEIHPGECSFMNSAEDHQSKIVELKYNPEFEEEALRIINGFPFRLTKSSKYVTGLQRVLRLPS